MHVWKNSEVVKQFLTVRRKAMPFGDVQLDILMRLISKSHQSVQQFVDLGCGDGILAHTILTQYPEAHGSLIDYSESMIEAAKKRLTEFENLEFAMADFSNSSWKEHVKHPPEVIVSGYAIHHLPNGRKYELFEEIHQQLAPGGIFVNIEHVASSSLFGKSLFDDLVVESLYARLNEDGDKKSKSELMREHLNRPDQYENILLPVTVQCDWLKEIGFIDVDCYFKSFELAVYAGIKK